MSNPKVQALADCAEFVFGMTASAAESIEAENRNNQMCPGKPTPHWLLGHLTNTLNIVWHVWAMNGSHEIPKDYAKIFAPDFAGGDPVRADGKGYPEWDEVVAAYKKITKISIADMRTLEDAELEQEAKGPMPDPLKVHFSSIGATLRQMINHDAHHRGQMLLLAKGKKA